MFLPAASYHLDLRPGHAFEFELAKLPAGDGRVLIRATSRGSGNHRLRARGDNVSLRDPEAEVRLVNGTPSTVEWQAQILTPGAPWTVVVDVIGDPANRKELMGGPSGR